MKGTKLPHRPRKRAKNIDKALQVKFIKKKVFIFISQELKTKKKNHK
jgi:hypothetical protein